MDITIDVPLLQELFVLNSDNFKRFSELTYFLSSVDYSGSLLQPWL